MKPEPMLRLLVLALAVSCGIKPPQTVAQPRNLMDPSLTELGYIPHIDIAPRGNQPSPAARAALADPLFGIDHEVASTSRFDARIQDLVRIVKEFGKPVIVRIGGEFNGPWNGYHPYAYPKAFRKIVQMFRAQQVENAAFVWCYEPAAPGDFDERNAAGEYKWFPGDDANHGIFLRPTKLC